MREGQEGPYAFSLVNPDPMIITMCRLHHLSMLVASIRSRRAQAVYRKQYLIAIRSDEISIRSQRYCKWFVSGVILLALTPSQTNRDPRVQSGSEFSKATAPNNSLCFLYVVNLTLIAQEILK